jgi:hypothetical protein
MPNLADGKSQANFSLDDEIVALLGTARAEHRRIDGSACSRPSEYVADLLRRDMIAKGLLPAPATIRVPRARTRNKPKKK